MELLLKNVSEEHLALLGELAKTLHFEVSEPIEDEAHYLKMMAEANNDAILSDEESASFINSLRSAKGRLYSVLLLPRMQEKHQL